MKRTKQKKLIAKRNEIIEVEAYEEDNSFFPTEESNDDPTIKYTLSQLREIMPQRWKNFAHEYIRNGFNKTQAYFKTFPDSQYQSAGVGGHNLLKNNKIQQYISYMRENIEEICHISVQKQVDFYMKIAYRNIGTIYDDWVDLKDWKRLSRDNPEVFDIIEGIEHRAIRKLDQNKTLVEVEQIRIKFPSRIAAAAKIDELLGYNKPIKVESNVISSLGQGNVAAIREAFGLQENNQ